MHLHSPPAGRRPPERGAALGAVEPHPERQVRGLPAGPCVPALLTRCSPGDSHGDVGDTCATLGAGAPSVLWQACAETGLLSCPRRLLSPTAGPGVSPPSTHTEPSSRAGRPLWPYPGPAPVLTCLSSVQPRPQGKVAGRGGTPLPAGAVDGRGGLAGGSGLGREGQATSLWGLRPRGASGWVLASGCV